MKSSFAVISSLRGVLQSRCSAAAGRRHKRTVVGSSPAYDMPCEQCPRDDCCCSQCVSTAVESSTSSTLPRPPAGFSAASPMNSAFRYICRVPQVNGGRIAIPMLHCSAIGQCPKGHAGGDNVVRDTLARSRAGRPFQSDTRARERPDLHQPSMREKSATR